MEAPHEANAAEHLSDDELAELWDERVGEGSPDTAPMRAVFDPDDELDCDGENGVALDNDDAAD